MTGWLYLEKAYRNNNGGKNFWYLGMRTLSHYSKILLTVCMLLSSAAFAETAQMTKNDNLREKPFSDARVVLPLTANQKVDIVTRNGAWYQISVAGKKGWAPMLSVRRSTTATTVSAGSLSTVSSGRTGTGTIVATTGIRGLNEESLDQAAFSEVAVAESEKFRTSSQEAASFAKAGKLKTRSVPKLPAPTKGAK